MTPTLKKILKWGGIAIAVALIIYIAMNFLGGGDDTPNVSTGGLVSSTGSNPIASVPSSAASASANESQVVALLKNLSALRLEASVFSNPAFAVLQDISIQLQPVTTQGRRNPFAAIGTDGTVAPAGSTTSPSSGPGTSSSSSSTPPSSGTGAGSSSSGSSGSSSGSSSTSTSSSTSSGSSSSSLLTGHSPGRP